MTKTRLEAGQPGIPAFCLTALRTTTWRNASRNFITRAYRPTTDEFPSWRQKSTSLGLLHKSVFLLGFVRAQVFNLFKFSPAHWIFPRLQLDQYPMSEDIPATVPRTRSGTGPKDPSERDWPNHPSKNKQLFVHNFQSGGANDHRINLQDP